MNQIKAVIPFAAGLAVLLLSGSACQAQDAPRACASVTPMERRIVERADLDLDNLRGFVWSRRGLSTIDMEDVKQSLDAWRAAVTCQKQVAAAAAAARLAQDAPTVAPDQQVAVAAH